MEKQLWEERQAITKAQEEKVKVAVTKYVFSFFFCFRNFFSDSSKNLRAKMIGVNISEHEAKVSFFSTF